MSVLDEARELVEKRLAVLNDEAERLQRALVELGESNGKPGRKPGRGGRPKGSGNKAKRGGGRKRGGQTRQVQLLNYLKANPNAKTKDVATALKMTDGHVNNLMTKSRGEGLLTRGPNREHVVKDAPAAVPASSDGGSKKSSGKKATRKRRGRRKGKAKKAAAKAPATEASTS